MSRVHTGAIVTALLLAGLVSCSSPSRPDAVGGSSSPGQSSTQPAASTGSAKPSGTPTSPLPSGRHSNEPPGATHLSDKYSRNNPPSDDFRRSDIGESRTGNERLNLLLRTKPGCVEMGDLMTFTAKTKPDVSVGLLTNVPDPEGRAREEAGRSDGQGLFSWTLLIPTNIREDNYTVFGAAADDKGEDGGITGTWLFYVAVPGGCR